MEYAISAEGYNIILPQYLMYVVCIWFVTDLLASAVSCCWFPTLGRHCCYVEAGCFSPVFFYIFIHLYGLCQLQWFVLKCQILVEYSSEFYCIGHILPTSSTFFLQNYLHMSGAVLRICPVLF